MTVKFFVITNVAAHEGHVGYQDLNEEGWREVDHCGPHGNILAEFDTEEEAVACLDKWLECDAPAKGTYCYSHNRHNRYGY